MDSSGEIEQLVEILGRGTEILTCSFCSKSIRLFDRLNTGKFACLSCSYIRKFTPSETAVFNSLDFDIHDDELRKELIIISEFDVSKADEDVSKISFILPEELWGPLSELIKKDSTSIDVEICMALSWYVSARKKNPTSSLGAEFFKIENSVKAESDELTKILLA